VQLAISGGAGIVLLLLASPLVGLLYGPEYAPSVAPLQILIPGIVAWSVSKLMSMVLVYNRGAGHRVTLIAVAGMLLNICLNVIGIRLLGWGVSGAAMASTITYLCVALLVLATYAGMERRLPAEG
jgi:O-antigen/teichoic acid export membrane protein